MSTTKSYEIIEVTATRIKAGVRTALVYEGYDITTYDIESEEWWGRLQIYDARTGEVISKELILDGQPDGPAYERLMLCELPADWMGLSFRCVGESNDATTSGGIDYLVNTDGARAAFEGWAKDLFAMAESLLCRPRYPYRDGPFMGNGTTRFLTLWEYNASQDYEGNWDCHYQLLGRLDPAMLTRALVDTPTEGREKDEHR